jgi:hypothetical protein
MIENAAVFVSGTKMKGLNVEDTDNEIILYNRVTKKEIKRYSVVEVAKAGEAWDVVDSSSQEGALLRLVAQQGCGCGGMKPYKTDPEYSGTLPGSR